ncbi:hypothetical protein C1H46_020590 [Malus baccata]|uniref:Uncharacterized protein n=1 Tax=Malus baccata TaxID=106549 RepID=A0A540M545_MALBA|nr:hypothetical protein C1H46_020590 [Malus baccata]
MAPGKMRHRVVTGATHWSQRSALTVAGVVAGMYRKRSGLPPSSKSKVSQFLIENYPKGSGTYPNTFYKEWSQIHLGFDSFRSEEPVGNCRGKQGACMHQNKDPQLEIHLKNFTKMLNSLLGCAAIGFGEESTTNSPKFVRSHSPRTGNRERIACMD